MGYPYHYLNLEFKQKLYLDFRERLTTFNESFSIEEREKRKENFMEKELIEYKKKIEEKYRQQTVKINKIENIEIKKNNLLI